MNLSNYCRQLSIVAFSCCLLAACASGAAPGDERRDDSTAQKAPNSDSDSAANLASDGPTTDPAYQLARGDEIFVSVYSENDLSAAQRIDTKGVIRLPYMGEVHVAGQSVRETESSLEKLLVDKKLLRKPMVTITVRDYAFREVSVLGAVGSSGKYRMPKERASLEILDVITGMGGFRPTAKSDEVKVTRVLDSGEEKVTTVDVQAMINPHKGDHTAPRSFLIYPGDRIFVPERLW